MKKLFLLVAVVAMMLPSCKKFEEAIDDINNRLDEIENTQIASLQEQVNAINATLPELKKTDKELKGYIENLQSTASNLQKSIELTNKEIESIEKELKNNISTAKSDVLAQLASVKSELEGELAQINDAITSLQNKDRALEDKINDLESYVNGEIQSTKDWVSQTFATLEKHNELSAEVASIKTQIESINKSLTALETRLNTKIKEDIEAAVSTLNKNIQQKVTEITKAYTDAISAAKEEVEAAYTQAIKDAISASETKMQQWVNNQLAGYYTMQEVNQMLADIMQEFNSKLEAQKAYLENLISELSEQLTKNISDNKELIDALREDLSSAQGEIATHKLAIADNAEQISNNATKITANAQAIAENSEDIEGNSQKIDENKSLIEANETLINSNKSAITSLQSNVDTNTRTIAKNAEEIAKNAALISANATAIGNNAQAISENTASIAQLRSELNNTAAEITEAYKEAIKTAINTLNGQLRDAIATEVTTINTRIDNEVATINATIDALDARVTALEQEVKTIKLTIYNMQADIAEMQEQIAALIERIQSLSFVPEFSDCKATMYYTENNGTITAGSATLKYEVRPAAVAEELVEVWEDALSVKAVYAQTRAAVGEFVNLTVVGASAKDGILTVVATGTNLEEGFFRNEISANVRLEVSNGYNCLTSDYVNMVPWTTNTVYIPDVNFKAYLVEKFDTDADSEISLAEAENITEIDIMGLMPQTTSLAGIEYFTNLEKLNCSFNRLRSLDLSNNKKLTEINANNNRLSSIDVSDNASLVKFYCNNNQLRKIDVTANAALQEFDIANNLLLTLNIRNNTALTYLNISNNAEISVVDTKYNTLLEVLVASGLAITDIDLTSNTALKGVELFNANLSSTKKLDTTGLGVVYIEKTPYNAGKMVSVAEGSSLKWSTSGITTSAIDSDNGTTNMAIIKALSSWETKYPAFKWCSDYGTDWYLPAFNELYTIYNNKSTINSILSTNGYTAFGTEDYWSSTEYNSNNACGVNFSFGISDGYATKGYKISVRAVLAF